jgi:UDP-N-acetylglucosamine:LPS N-acetylglucosamine transferase
MIPTLPKPILFFATLAAGGGHVATAKAMAEGVETHAPRRFATVVSDYMLELGFAEQDRQHKEGWAWMLAHPWSARYGQWLLDAFPRLTNRYHRVTLDALARRAAEHLGALEPALVVVNHGWLMVALTRAQRRYGLRSKVLTFATEPLDASALWGEADAERVVAPSQAALRDLVRHGVPKSRIDVIGYPVQGAFLQAPAKAEARARLGLPGRFTCLVSLGGEGVGGHAESVVQALAAHPLEPQVVVITGRNAALRARLEGAHNVRTLGFIDTVPDYLAACDVVVGKAGPASVLEALAVGRPFVAVSYAGLNEAKLVRFLTQKQLGCYAPAPDALAEALTRFADPAVGARVAVQSQQLGLPQMTRDLAAYLVRAAEQGFPERPLRLPGLGG